MQTPQISGVTGSPSEPALLLLMERTGYPIVQVNGQRKFGPPPNWEGSVPSRGCEIFVGKVPREMFEDELIPIFQRCGTIYQFRLMMDFSGFNKGFAFCTYKKKSEAKRAVKELNNYEIRKGRFIGVCESVDNNRLFIGGIPKMKVREDILTEMSKASEGVVDVIVYPSAQDKTKNRGFAFVEYETHRAAAMARRKLNTSGQFELWGHQIAVDWADPEPDTDEDVMATVKNLYVRNLMLTTTEEHIQEVFDKAAGKTGSVERVKKLRDFAFVHFRSREDAMKAMEAMNGTLLDNSKINVELAKPVDRNEHNQRVARAKNLSQLINACKNRRQPEADCRLCKTHAAYLRQPRKTHFDYESETEEESTNTDIFSSYRPQNDQFEALQFGYQESLSSDSLWKESQSEQILSKFSPWNKAEAESESNSNRILAADPCRVVGCKCSTHTTTEQYPSLRNNGLLNHLETESGYNSDESYPLSHNPCSQVIGSTAMDYLRSSKPRPVVGRQYRNFDKSRDTLSPIDSDEHIFEGTARNDRDMVKVQSALYNTMDIIQQGTSSVPEVGVVGRGRGRGSAGSRAAGSQKIYTPNLIGRRPQDNGLYDLMPGVELTPINPITLKPQSFQSPTQILEELCRKNNWGTPNYRMFSAIQRDPTTNTDTQYFLFKVMIPALVNQSITPDKVCRTIEEARIYAAEYTLLHLGMPIESSEIQVNHPPPPTTVTNLFQGRPLAAALPIPREMPVPISSTAPSFVLGKVVPSAEFHQTAYEYQQPVFPQYQ